MVPGLRNPERGAQTENSARSQAAEQREHLNLKGLSRLHPVLLSKVLPR